MMRQKSLQKNKKEQASTARKNGTQTPKNRADRAIKNQKSKGLTARTR